VLAIRPTTIHLPKQTVIAPVKGRFQTSMQAAVRSDPLIDFIKPFQHDIYAYCDVLGVSPHWQQKQFLDAYQAGESRITCRAGKGPGKSFVTAIAMSHWSLTHAKSSLIVTAPTFRQCKDVWLSQVYDLITSSRANPKLKEYFTFRGTGYGILGAKNAEWGCQLVTALKKEAFQGMHKLWLAFLEEEASGVPTEISNAISETISNAKGHYLHVKIGNPNTRLCVFFDSFNKDASKWHKLHWNTEETPETEYFSKRRNDDIAEEFGRNSDIYRISVLGEFPNLDPNCLISEEDLDACCTPEALQRALHENPDSTKQIGLDLARYGGDECVVVWRRGGVLYGMWADKTDPNNAIDKAVAGQISYDWDDHECTYVVDTSGMGEAVVGQVGGANRMGKRVHEFYSQNTAKESNKYDDKITEAWVHFSKLVKKRLVYLGEKIDKKLKTQLTTRRYVVTPKGKIKIESKDDYKKNNKDSENGTIGKSPDRADGVVMAFYPHATVSSRIAVGG
jgi:phage terminase large subunit